METFGSKYLPEKSMNCYKIECAIPFILNGLSLWNNHLGDGVNE